MLQQIHIDSVYVDATSRTKMLEIAIGFRLKWFSEWNNIRLNGSGHDELFPDFRFDFFSFIICVAGLCQSQVHLTRRREMETKSVFIDGQ